MHLKGILFESHDSVDKVQRLVFHIIVFPLLKIRCAAVELPFVDNFKSKTSSQLQEKVPVYFNELLSETVLFQ